MTNHGEARALRPPVRARATDAMWHRWMRDFGQHVRRVREFVGLSQDQLAVHAHVSQGAVSRFESGRGLNTPFIGILKINLALARALAKVDPSTLTEDVRRFLRHMDLIAPKAEPEEPPASVDGASIPELTITHDPRLEQLIRAYQRMPEGRRQAFLTVVNATATALVK